MQVTIRTADDAVPALLRERVQVPGSASIASGTPAHSTCPEATLSADSWRAAFVRCQGKRRVLTCKGLWHV